MKNTSTDLRDELFNVFRAVKSRRMKPSAASGLANIAGKIISTVRLEMDFHRIKDRPQLRFFGEKAKANGTGRKPK